MIFLDLPNINGKGTPEQQLAEIRSYIYKNNEQINTALSNLTIDKIWEQTASAVSSAGQSEDETPKILKQYQRIRDLIIKTADVVAQSDEKMEMAFNGSYLAKSQFGEYFKKTKVAIGQDSVGITELYDYNTELKTGFETYKLDYECYIKRGLLDDTTTPIYGIELGVLNDTIILYDEDGKPVEHHLDRNKRFRTRITPDKWSFFQGGTEVAYIDANAIWFPSANITGGSIDIGANHEFKVLSDGTMTATSGTFGGTLDASKISIKNSIKNAWNNCSNNYIQLDSNKLKFYSYSIDDNTIQQTFQLSEESISFYKRDGVDKVMAELRRNHFYYNNSHWGIELSLKTGIGEYFSLGYPYTLNGANYYEYGFTYVPPVATGAESMPFPFNGGEGLYIDTPIHVFYHNRTNNTYIRYNTVADDSFTIGNTTYHIRNGLITTS